MNCVLVTRQIHKTPPILKLTHNFEARVCTLAFSYLSKVTKGKGCALDADIKSRLASLYEPMYSPTFPFTSALPISFNRPGLFGTAEKSNAKNGGTYAQIFRRAGLVFCFFFICFFFFIILFKECTIKKVTKTCTVTIFLKSQFTLFKHLYMCK